MARGYDGRERGNAYTSGASFGRGNGPQDESEETDRGRGCAAFGCPLAGSATGAGGGVRYCYFHAITPEPVHHIVTRRVRQHVRLIGYVATLSKPPLRRFEPGGPTRAVAIVRDANGTYEARQMVYGLPDIPETAIGPDEWHDEYQRRLHAHLRRLITCDLWEQASAAADKADPRRGAVSFSELLPDWARRETGHAD